MRLLCETMIGIFAYSLTLCRSIQSPPFFVENAHCRFIGIWRIFGGLAPPPPPLKKKIHPLFLLYFNGYHLYTHFAINGPACILCKFKMAFFLGGGRGSSYILSESAVLCAPPAPPRSTHGKIMGCFSWPCHRRRSVHLLLSHFTFASCQVGLELHRANLCGSWDIPSFICQGLIIVNISMKIEYETISGNLLVPCGVPLFQRSSD